MAVLIPNLWSKDKEAERLYALYLVHLGSHYSPNRVVQACRTIRRHAHNSREWSGSVWFYEIDALCELREYDRAWRQFLRWRRESELSTESHADWTVFEFSRAAHFEAPLLYFRGHYERGTEVLSAALIRLLNRRKRGSADLLACVYNRTREPWDRCGVTLAHFYRRLRRKLNEWEGWKRFVRGFPPEMFHGSGIDRDQLLRDAKLLPALSEHLIKLKNLEYAATKKERHDAEARDAEQKRARRAMRNARLEALFPELRGLLSVK